MSRAVFDAMADMALHGSTDRYRALLEAGDPAHARAEVHRSASFHLVRGFVGAALSAAPDVDPALAAHLHQFRQQVAVDHLRTMADLAWLAPRLDGAGVAWAVLKGPFLVEHAHRRVDVRRYGDLDVLVDRHVFGDVLDLLQREGARLTDRNWPLIAATNRGELSLLLPRGTLLDLHWHLVVDAHVRRGFRIDVDDVLARRRDVGGAALRLPALAADDAWFHTAMHAVLSGGDRLLWAMDLDRLIEVDGPCTADSWSRARRFGWGCTGAMAADLVAEVNPARAAEAATAPSFAWRRLRRMALGDAGINRSLDGTFSSRLFVTSARRTTAASVGALGAAIWDQAIKGPIANRDHPWRTRRRAGEAPAAARPSPLKSDVPSPDAAREFFRAISA